MARLCTARSSVRMKLRGSNKAFRRHKTTNTWKNCTINTHRPQMGKVRQGNCDERAPPTHTRSGQLYSKMGFFLTVLYNNTLHGVNLTYCQRTKRCTFQLQSCGTSIIRIKHEQSGRYVAINKAGKVYTTPKSQKSSTLLIQEMIANGWTVFKSERGYRKGKCMYLALKKNGSAKRSLRSKKFVQFVVL